jgi:thiol:disulfide interchange protein DsbD
VTGDAKTGIVPVQRSSHKDAGLASTNELTSLAAVGIAFAGGVILNLMPCVFPVLFLKAFSLVNASTEEHGRQKMHGIVYALGILASFWVMVGVLLILRAGGRAVGWGFQLQSPTFVAVLASVMFFLGLSLAGQFELGLTLTSKGDSLSRSQGLSGSFFTGVLSTVVATPCMGPFMGAAVGYALVQPAWLTFVVFTALAIGLAAPYLVLCFQPKAAQMLPRPGAWMEIFKQATALVMFATAIGLSWVYMRVSGGGPDGRIRDMLLCFLILAIAGWTLGRWPAKRGSSLAAAGLIALALYFPLRKTESKSYGSNLAGPGGYRALAVGSWGTRPRRSSSTRSKMLDRRDGIGSGRTI